MVVVLLYLSLVFCEINGSLPVVNPANTTYEPYKCISHRLQNKIEKERETEKGREADSSLLSGLKWQGEM